MWQIVLFKFDSVAEKEVIKKEAILEMEVIEVIKKFNEGYKYQDVADGRHIAISTWFTRYFIFVILLTWYVIFVVY